MKISNETKVGTIATISITILILGYNFMKGENLFTSYNRYYAAYEDVDGLFKSNPVLINGYKIGQVSDVVMDPKTLKLLVEVKVPNNIKVSKDAVIKIVNTDTAIVRIRSYKPGTVVSVLVELPTGGTRTFKVTLGSAPSL